jgi:hypothetical protein
MRTAALGSIQDDLRVRGEGMLAAAIGRADLDATADGAVLTWPAGDEFFARKVADPDRLAALNSAVVSTLAVGVQRLSVSDHDWYWWAPDQCPHCPAGPLRLYCLPVGEQSHDVERGTTALTYKCEDGHIWTCYWATGLLERRGDRVTDARIPEWMAKL